MASVPSSRRKICDIISPEIDRLRGVLYIVQAGNDIIKEDFVHTKRTIFPTEMKIGIYFEEPIQK